MTVYWNRFSLKWHSSNYLCKIITRSFTLTAYNTKTRARYFAKHSNMQNWPKFRPLQYVPLALLSLSNIKSDWNKKLKNRQFFLAVGPQLPHSENDKLNILLSIVRDLVFFMLCSMCSKSRKNCQSIDESGSDTWSKPNRGGWTPRKEQERKRGRIWNKRKLIIIFLRKRCNHH